MIIDNENNRQLQPYKFLTEMDKGLLSRETSYIMHLNVQHSNFIA